jgi:hypothetical protein
MSEKKIERKQQKLIDKALKAEMGIDMDEL